MRGLPKPLAAFSLAMAVLFCLGGGVVGAQQSADEIINTLKPASSSISGSAPDIKMGSAPGQLPPSADHPASAAAASTPQPSVAARPSINLTVNFLNGSAELTQSARISLDALGKALTSSDLAGFRFRIEGHTDNVGSREENRALSQQRAEAVVSYLTSQFNVAPARLEAVGMGQEHLLIETPPQTPEARNRRILVINAGA